MGRTQTIVSVVVPGLMVLGAVRTQTEKATVSKSVSYTPHPLCLGSCLYVPARSGQILAPVLTDEQQCFGSVSK